LLLIGVLFVGLGIGAGVAYAVGQLRSAFSTPHKLEKSIGLPVIGSITLTITDAARALRQRRLRQFAGAAAGLVGVLVILLAIEIISVGTIV
jgi:hypothetical protein